MSNPCQRIPCTIPDDFRAYGLQGFPPQPLPPTEPPPVPPFSSAEVYYTCDETINFTGTLPGWIVVDSGNNRLVGDAGTFRGDTPAEATASAQAALNAFAAAAMESGDLTCAMVDCPQWETLVWTQGETQAGSGVVINVCTGANFDVEVARTVVFGVATAFAQSSIVYNGPGCNCNLHVTSIHSGNAFGSVQIVGTGTLVDHAIPPDAAGAYDLPFSIPDTLGADLTINITVQANTDNGGAQTIGFHGYIENV